VFAPVHRPLDGPGRDVHFFDASGTGWTVVPDVPMQAMPGVLQAASREGVRFVDTGPRLFTLAPGARGWSALEVPPGHGLVVAGRFLVSLTNDDARLVLRIVSTTA
jgi:hypothetical protein